MADRLLGKVCVCPSGCWIWLGVIANTGYGEVRFLGRKWLAHRLSYENFVGPIPDGLVIDHLCRQPSCINPAHLEPVTIGENVRRGMSLAAQRARQTECLRGHPFDDTNTSIRANGSRRCRRCAAEAMRARRARAATTNPNPAKETP